MYLLVSWSKKYFPPLPHPQQLFFLKWTFHQNTSITDSILATQSEKSEQTTGSKHENNRIKLELVSEEDRRHLWKHWLETEIRTLFFLITEGVYSKVRILFTFNPHIIHFQVAGRKNHFNYIVRIWEVICWPKSHSKSSEIKVFWLFYPVNFLSLFSSTVT